MTPFKRVTGEGEINEPASSPGCTQQNELLISPGRATSFGTRDTPRLPALAAISKPKNLVRRVCKPFKIE